MATMPTIRSSGSLFRRHDRNPILEPSMWPYTVNAVMNPGATVGPDGETVLLVRVEDRTGISHLTVARSLNGVTGWVIDPKPTFVAAQDLYSEAWGIEDPRITRCGGEYLVCYTGFSRGGPLVCLASTRDFQHFERRGVLMPPDDKDAALFPYTFGGRWALIHRPLSAASAYVGVHVWLSWSPDLRHWGDHEVLIHARQGGWWDATKVGLGPPPLLTADGWLVLYHGVRKTASGSIYRGGLALIDRDDPSKVLARANEWVIGPETEYERSGDVSGVVFPSGWVLEDDEQSIRMYYGGADTCVALATARADDLVTFIYSHCVCGGEHAIGSACPVVGQMPEPQARPG
jgi:predicted GH43/DUF377 family glycosyl hydrolase